MKTQELLRTLTKQTEKQLAIAQTEFALLNLQQLNFKPDMASWSILECLEHLNRYSRFYLPLFDKAILGAAIISNQDEDVRYSWLGSYSIKLVDPKNRKKSKTLKHMNPNGNLLTRQALDEFIAHQVTLLGLLKTALQADLSRKTIPVEFLRIMKMTTAEALEFVCLHQERHVQQAQRVQAQLAMPERQVLVV